MGRWESLLAEAREELEARLKGVIDENERDEIVSEVAAELAGEEDCLALAIEEGVGDIYEHLCDEALEAVQAKLEEQLAEHMESETATITEDER